MKRKPTEKRHAVSFFTDSEAPSEAMGMVFVYAGDPNALIEGRFDRKLWELQMHGTTGVFGKQ